MIQTFNLAKCFEKASLLYDLNCEIKDNNVYGSVAAGKSTFIFKNYKVLKRRKHFNEQTN